MQLQAWASSLGDRLKTRPTAFGAAMFVVAGLLGLHSLALPFGDDQGLYFYVAREWRSGRIPYRDVFDHKPPGIYVVHRLAMLVFGENTASIRIADLACLAVLGGLAARLAVPRGRPLPRGLLGVGAAVAVLLHFGFFDYWNTAQTEVWYTTLGFAAVALAARMQSLPRAALLSGVTTGLALLLKPTSICYAFVGFVILFWRGLGREDGARPSRAPMDAASLRRVTKLTAWFVVATIVPFATTILYFAAHGALGAMFDIVVLGNSHYARTFKNATTFVDTARHLFDFVRSLSTLGAVVLVSLVVRTFVAVRLRDREMLARYSLSASFILAGFAAVTMQQKFFGVHWVTMVGPMTYAVVVLVEDARAFLEKRGLGERLARVVPVLGVGVLYASSAFGDLPLLREAPHVYRYVTGQISREEYARFFFSVPMNYYQVDIDATSAFLRENARPGDTICVRGFSPQIYVQTGLRYEGRFFWTNFIFHPLSYRRADFIREEHDAIVRTRPRYVMAVKAQEGNGNIESRETYAPLGYTLVREFGSIQVLEYLPNRER